MNTIDNIFPEIYSFEALYNAYLKARKGKRYRGDVLRFTNNLESNLIELQNELIWDTYEVGPYRKFYVHEPKKRLVMALGYRDRIVQWAIYNQLNPFYDKTFIEDSYACRIGKGSHRAADRLAYWLRLVKHKPGKWYCLKLDISKYFYRVDHQVLENILARRIRDDRLMGLLHRIINSEDTPFGLPAGIGPDGCPDDLWLWDVGMPIGNLTSQLFANIYLNEFDQYCKHQLHTRFYERYMDDTTILGNDKGQLREWQYASAEFLHDNLHLDLNNKTVIQPADSGIEFVGYRIWPTHRKLRKQTAQRIIRHTKNQCALLAAGEISRKSFDRTAASYRGILKYCDSDGLRHKLNEIYVRTCGQKMIVTTSTADDGRQAIKIFA